MQCVAQPIEEPMNAGFYPYAYPVTYLSAWIGGDLNAYANKLKSLYVGNKYFTPSRWTWYLNNESRKARRLPSPKRDSILHIHSRINAASCQLHHSHLFGSRRKNWPHVCQYLYLKIDHRQAGGRSSVLHVRWGLLQPHANINTQQYAEFINTVWI